MKFEKLLIFDKPRTTVQEMKNICIGLQKEKKISFVIVDHLSLITETKKTENETVRVGNIARDLKILAKELNVPVFVLCQLNRMVDSRTDKRPTLSDLKSSGGIEENADLVLFIYRDDYYDHNKKTNVAEIIVRKNRNGKEGSTRFITNFEICRFEDCDFRNEPKIMAMPKRKFYPNGTPNYRGIYES